MALFLSVLQTISDVVPVDNIPNSLQVIGSDVLVLQIVGVLANGLIRVYINTINMTYLPHVEAQKWHQIVCSQQGILVGASSNGQATSVLAVA